MGVTEGLTFGPPLIMNGKKVIRSGDGGWGISPRSAIGQKKDGTMMFLVIDGRQPGTVSEPLWWMCRILCMKKARILRRIWTAVPVRPCIITAM